MLRDAKVCPTVAVSDLEKARRFYEDTLGLAVWQEMPDERIVLYGNADNTLQIYESANAGTNHATYVTWEVDDIHDVAEALRDKGVVFEHYPDMPNVELEGDVHRWDEQLAAWFRDPDGNILCLHGEE